MRVASISKCMTACIAMYMVERGWLDLDKDIALYIESQNYAPKLRDGSTAVVITTRQLLSHMAGLRHYRKIETASITDSNETTVDLTNLSKKTTQQRPALAIGDAQYPEFFLNKQFKTAADAVAVFKDDALETAPGEKFLYTTFGYTLLSMVLEKAAEQAGVGRVAIVEDDKKKSSGEKPPKENPYSFQNLFQNLIVKRLALFHTYLDVNDKIIPNRARYYVRDQKDYMLKNTPEVDNSCKWAGGGVLSTCGDLVQFGNALLMSHQQSRHAFPLLETFLKPASVDMLWKNVDRTDNIRGTAAYGLGFFITPSDHWLRWYTTQNSSSFGQQSASAYMTNTRTRVVYHSGGAVGASSVLLIVPRAAAASAVDDAVITDDLSCDISTDRRRHPSGVVVALMCNLQGVGLYQQALELCKIFDAVEIDDNNSFVQ